MLDLLDNGDEDVQAAALRAARLLMTPPSPVPTVRWKSWEPPTREQLVGETAGALRERHLVELLSALEAGGERLRLEAIATACAVAENAFVSAADLDGLLRMMQNLSSDPILSVKVHDAADTAVEVLRRVQQRKRASGGVTS